MVNSTVHNFNHIHNKATNTKTLLGGKGANLNTMSTVLNLPVPQGFTIPCHLSKTHEGSTSLNSILRGNVFEAIDNLSEESGRTFNDIERPLLVSVRSGAPVSMPGMMDTVLNLGLNDKTVKALAAETNEDFAYDSYRRFIQMYASIVLADDHSWYAERTATATKFFDARPIPAEASRLLIDSFKARASVPSDPLVQLQCAILAVFRSWNSDKAKTYREIENIPDDIGTAVNVQRMVFGNLNSNSGTGVAFTRNPNTGQAHPYGDYLVNAQGEDVVDGSTVTQPLAEMHDVFPAQAAELDTIMATLETHYNDMCDIEFTIEDGKLFMLQTRIGKRSSLAEVRIVADLLAEGRISPDAGVERLNKAHANAKPKVDLEFKGTKVAVGLGASGSLVVGKAYFTKEGAIEAAENGEDVILIRNETSPEDTAAMAKSVGILTLTGGLVSHAAVVARGWDKTAVVGLGEEHTLTSSFIRFSGDIKVKVGETIAINGENGEVLVPSHKISLGLPTTQKAVTKPTVEDGKIIIKSTKYLTLGDLVTLPASDNAKLKYQYEYQVDKDDIDNTSWTNYHGYIFNSEDTQFEVVKVVSPFIALLKGISPSLNKGIIWRVNFKQTNFYKKQMESF